MDAASRIFYFKKNQLCFSGHKLQSISSKRHVNCVHGSSIAGVSMKIRHAMTSKGGEKEGLAWNLVRRKYRNLFT